MEQIPLPLMIILAFIGFALFWLGIVWLIAWVAGWPQLHEKYPGKQGWNEQCWSLQSAVFRAWVSYRNILKVCVDPEGLHLSVMFPFSVSQKPLFIPWIDVTVTKKRWGFVNGFELRFQQVPNVPIRITKSLAKRIAEGANEAWPMGAIISNQ